MRKQLLFSFLLILNSLLNLYLIVIETPETSVCVYYAIVTVLLVAWGIVCVDERRFTYSAALLAYLIITQFGMVIPVELLGRECVDNYKDHTVWFLDSDQLPLAVLLGTLAVNTFTLGILFSRKNRAARLRVQSLMGFDKGDFRKELRAGTALLAFVFLCFVYQIMVGGLPLFGSYTEFCTSSFQNTALYHYLLIIFYVGTIYIASAGNVKQNRKSWFIWLLIVVYFALNGNKGEFMYSLLAVFGMMGVKGQKISGKVMLIGIALIFLIIPSITALRGIGIARNLGELKFSSVESFTEMGMQLRCTVATLERLAKGTIATLDGMSYLQPIINILTPFSRHTTATQHLTVYFQGWGYNQVIESYLNFGTYGVVLYFSVVGYLMGRCETGIKQARQLAYLGTIVCVLINATRNYFQFVPGQIVIVTLIYLFTIWKRKKASKPKPALR